MPMFPDSGVPANEALNTIDVSTVTPCDELWYSTSRCQPRFDPAAANAMLAEIMATINKGEVTYDCKSLNQLQYAVRYINQRGIPRSAVISGADNYVGKLDPQCTRYNDLMTLSVLPQQDNTGPVQLNLDDLGLRPVYRNDGQNLKSKDFRVNIPTEIIHWSGAWYVVGAVASQIPELKTGQVMGWIRTDGLDDPSHDGTENTPQKAFRTIRYAYETLGAKYFPSPQLQLLLRFGIPGRYVGCSLGPYGGTIQLLGDEANAAGYEIGPDVVGGITNSCLTINATTLALNGVTLIADAPSGNWANLRVRAAGTVTIKNCRFEARLALVGGFMTQETAGSVGTYGTNWFLGNGNTMAHAWAVMGGQFLGSNQVPNTIMNISGCQFTRAGVVSSDLGFSQFPATTIIQAGCTGPRYLVTDNSLIRAGGQVLPGNAAGVVQDNGLYFP